MERGNKTMIIQIVKKVPRTLKELQQSCTIQGQYLKKSIIFLYTSNEQLNN